MIKKIKQRIGNVGCACLRVIYDDGSEKHIYCEEHKEQDEQ